MGPHSTLVHSTAHLTHLWILKTGLTPAPGQCGKSKLYQRISTGLVVTFPAYRNTGKQTSQQIAREILWGLGSETFSEYQPLSHWSCRRAQACVPVTWPSAPSLRHLSSFADQRSECHICRDFLGNTPAQSSRRSQVVSEGGRCSVERGPGGLRVLTMRLRKAVLLGF